MIAVGVDTHKNRHIAVAMDRLGQLFGELSIEACAAGYLELELWALALAEDGQQLVFGIEGAGSWGAGLCEHLQLAGCSVLEVDRSRSGSFQTTQPLQAAAPGPVQPAAPISSGIIRFLPIVKLDPGRTVIGAYLLAAALTTLAAALFVVIVPDVAHNYRFLRDGSGIAVMYVVAVALWGVFVLQDSVLTALRRAPWVAVENTTFGVLKIAALPLLLALGSGHAVFIAWVIPMAILVVPVNYLIFAKVIPNWPRRETESSPVERFGWLVLWRFLALDYMAFARGARPRVGELVSADLGPPSSSDWTGEQARVRR
jgi:hypothetical protein